MGFEAISRAARAGKSSVILPVEDEDPRAVFPDDVPLYRLAYKMISATGYWVTEEEIAGLVRWNVFFETPTEKPAPRRLGWLFRAWSSRKNQ
jgi:hypothetical protein